MRSLWAPDDDHNNVDDIHDVNDDDDNACTYDNHDNDYDACAYNNHDNACAYYHDHNVHDDNRGPDNDNHVHDFHDFHDNDFHKYKFNDHNDRPELARMRRDGAGNSRLDDHFPTFRNPGNGNIYEKCRLLPVRQLEPRGNG